jgi:hypothetical protein
LPGANSPTLTLIDEIEFLGSVTISVPAVVAQPDTVIVHTRNKQTERVIEMPELMVSTLGLAIRHFKILAWNGNPLNI